VTAQGVLQADARAGEPVRATNTASHKLVTAVLSDEHTVTVVGPYPHPLYAPNSPFAAR